MADRRVEPDLARRHRRIALACTVCVFAMVGASYAAVPLYNLFCRVTGFAGTPVRAEKAPDRQGDRRFTIRLDANVNGIPWRFIPEEKSVSVRAGEVRTIDYRIVNTSWNHTRGIASYNVTPEAAAPYFSKISCFCFSEQTLEPGQQLELPVVFFVDPAMSKDRGLDSISTITLSYTFFPSDKPATPVAKASDDGVKPKS